MVRWRGSYAAAKVVAVAMVVSPLWLYERGEGGET
jgi:hypothetical protein